LVDFCGYELPTNLQYFTQKDLTEMKIFLKVLRGLLFWKHPVDAVGNMTRISWHTAESNSGSFLFFRFSLFS